jgi:hypothetical protein
MSIYHLHIPRTSGGFIRKRILPNFNGDSVVGHYRTISNEDFKKANFISGHYGLNPCEFVDKTFTVLRNPNELTFSYIKYLSIVSGKYEFNEDFLKQYLYEDNLRFAVTNVNIKFLSASVNIHKYNKNINDLMNMANSLWYLEVEELSVKNAINQIKNNNISIFFYDSEKIYENIYGMLGIESGPTDQYRVNQSFVDTKGLYEKYFDEISMANKIDLDFYKEVLNEPNV